MGRGRGEGPEEGGANPAPSLTHQVRQHLAQHLFQDCEEWCWQQPGQRETGGCDCPQRTEDEQAGWALGLWFLLSPLSVGVCWGLGASGLIPGPT